MTSLSSKRGHLVKGVVWSIKGGIPELEGAILVLEHSCTDLWLLSLPWLTPTILSVSEGAKVGIFFWGPVKLSGVSGDEGLFYCPIWRCASVQPLLTTTFASVSSLVRLKFSSVLYYPPELHKRNSNKNPFRLLPSPSVHTETSIPLLLAGIGTDKPISCRSAWPRQWAGPLRFGPVFFTSRPGSLNWELLQNMKSLTWLYTLLEGPNHLFW